SARNPAGSSGTPGAASQPPLRFGREAVECLVPDPLVLLQDFRVSGETRVHGGDARRSGARRLDPQLDVVAQVRVHRREPGPPETAPRLDCLVLPLDPSGLTLRALKFQTVLAARPQVDVRAGEAARAAPPPKQLGRFGQHPERVLGSSRDLPRDRQRVLLPSGVRGPALHLPDYAATNRMPRSP